MDRNRTFWDKNAQRYARRKIGNMPAYEQTLAHVRRYLSKDQKVLEIGCGTGSTALLLAPDAGHITATDISPNMIAIARAKPETAELGNVTFTAAELADDKIGEGMFDTVLAFNLLHLVPETGTALRAIHRRLRPGGLFISKTVCLAEYTIFLRALISVMKVARIAPDVRYLSSQSLNTAIGTAGFEIVETALYPASGRAHFVVARKV
ncbi:class I SAM-dependent methyltransferase [Thalassospira sp.]|uniref:class I SAM-dependent methyltransferase n=1 Tax=Thalassospira sp. TaxID=1912094 RepID=UPI0027336C80|nr:class I SAM-dependent methyltransferase [Thalassospira sp.]MDP2697506.1 class I SAM-dependent methyltransferase [Thalassospira sp.]